MPKLFDHQIFRAQTFYTPDEEREALKDDLLDFISRFLRMVELELNFEFNQHGKIRGQIKGIVLPYMVSVPSVVCYTVVHQRVCTCAQNAYFFLLFRTHTHTHTHTHNTHARAHTFRHDSDPHGFSEGIERRAKTTPTCKGSCSLSHSLTFYIRSTYMYILYILYTMKTSLHHYIYEDTFLNRTPFPTPSTTLACISNSEMRTPH